MNIENWRHSLKGIGDSSGKPVFKPNSVAFTIDELLRVLDRAGFTTTYTRHINPLGEQEGLGLFFASRTQEENATAAG